MPPFCVENHSNGKPQLNVARIAEALLIVALTVAAQAVVTTQLLKKDIEALNQTNQLLHTQVDQKFTILDARIERLENRVFFQAPAKDLK